METVKGSTDFQIEIPQSIRDSININPGQQLHAIPIDNRIELIPVISVSQSRGFLRGINTDVHCGEGRI